MSAVVSRRKTCRLCDGRKFDLVLRLAPVPPVDAYVPVEEIGKVQEAYPLDLYLCRACGHLQLLDIVDPTLLYGNYIYETASSLGLVEHFNRYGDELVEHLNLPNGALVVDIGSNDGTLLRSFRRKGMRVLGVDPARQIAQKATESGVETLAAFFTRDLSCQIKEKYGSVSLVTANNVFANIDDLVGFVEDVREMLLPDGVFVFEVFYLPDLIQNMAFDFIYHEHLDYHSVGPLESFFRRNGMELLSVQRVATKGGSLRCTVQRAGGPRAVSRSVRDMIAFEESIGIHRPDTFKVFGAKIEEIKGKLAQLLRDFRGEGKTLVGYGASATSTMLIYQLGLDGMLNSIVDDNPSRQNLFSPGCHIPVVSSSVIYDQKPDYVLVLAWRYLEAILQKHQKYLEQNGHFIVPLPELRII